MRPAPLTDDLRDRLGNPNTMVISAPDGDLTNPEIAPVEAAVLGTRFEGGVATTYVIRLIPEDDDVEILASPRGSVLLFVYAEQLPVFSVKVVP